MQVGAAPFLLLEGEITGISTVKNGAERWFCGIKGVPPVNWAAAAPFMRKRWE
jgi:hypothetical protein